jgi:hypothetical protein
VNRFTAYACNNAAGCTVAGDWVSQGGTATSLGFDAITAGSNTSAAMTVGSGATLGPIGSGTITANKPMYCADAGSTDDYACNLSPVPTAYITGGLYRFKANTTNTGAATINFNALGAKTIKKAVGGVTTDLSDSDIRLGQIVDLVYDGTNMQIQSTLGNTPTSGANASGYYVVNQVANAPANAINLGALTTGLLKGTVSAGISTLSTAVAGTDYQAPISNYSTISGLTGYPASFTPATHASTHASAGGDPVTLAESQITNLTTDLAAKAPLASPTFTGTVTMPAPTLNNVTGSTQCLHVNTSGVVSGTGSDCGAGGSGADANGYYLVGRAQAPVRAETGGA